MAESPLAKLARLFGGAAMLQGPLGYQVLGQMLITRSTVTELAGANVVLAAVSRQTNAAVQIAVRSMVPAVLVEALSRKERHRLQRLSSELEHLLKNLEDRSAEVCGKPEWMRKALQKHKTPESLEEALFGELLKLRCQGGQPERRVKALQYLLKECEPARAADGRNRLNAKTTDKHLEVKSDKEPEASSIQGNQAADAPQKSAARWDKKGTVKEAAMEKPVKKRKAAKKGKGKTPH